MEDKGDEESAQRRGKRAAAAWAAGGEEVNMENSSNSVYTRMIAIECSARAQQSRIGAALFDRIASRRAYKSAPNGN